MLKIYNTLTRQKEEFKPQDTNYVKMYTCGVTVYDDCHIGHGRSLYIFEVMRRYLKYKGFNIKLVRNITDIDDKIIDKARDLSQKENISLKEAFEAIRKKYIESYYQDLELLYLPAADIEPKATENIPDMIDYINKLINKNFAYEKKGSVYFSLRRFPSYGKLSGKKIDDLFSGVRIIPDPLKNDPFDFALWKKAKEGEPSWDSPWGKGRPGWHIECSVMSQKYLKTSTLDIHGGGRDLIFPHHENEIAQSESLNDAPFSLYWLHHGLVTWEGEKMAKSLKNFFTIKEVLKVHHQETLKLFYLSAHYRSPLNFSWEALQEANRQRERIYVIYNRLKDILAKPLRSSLIIELKKKFDAAMDDDFNFSLAKSIFFELSSIVSSRDKNDSLLGEIKTFFFAMGKIFVLFEEEKSLDKNLISYIEEKVKLRERLRKEKKFSEADKIREDLNRKGVILEDLQNGTTLWRVKE